MCKLMSEKLLASQSHVDVLVRGLKAVVVVAFRDREGVEGCERVSCIVYRVASA